MQVRLKLFFEWGIIFPKEIYTVPDKGNRTVSYARQAVLEQNINSKYHPRSAGDKMTQEEIDDREEKFEMSQKSPRKNTQDKSKKKNGKPTGDKKTGAPCAHSIPMSESNLPPVERDAIIINEKGEECDASALERV